MTSQNSSYNKDHFKLIEIALDKFHSEALPYHVQLHQQHKDIIEKCMSNKNSEQLSYEIKNKTRIVKQLKDLLYELDSLRTRVYDEDLDKFDSKTFSFRKSVSSLLKDYSALEKSAIQYLDSQNEINENIENENPFNEIDQIQISENVNKLKLEEAEDTYHKIEALNNDIESLHGIYVDLNTMVCTQKEHVNTIGSNIETTQDNVKQGLFHLINAHRLKSATYPISGAVLGGLVGGPVGLLAGFKVGGLAALGCGIVGYTGGKLFKNYNNPPHKSSDNSNIEEHISTESNIKKDV